MHFSDLSYNNNLIFVSNTTYVNGLYNTLSSSIQTTNINLISISSNLYLNYVTKDLLQLQLKDYVTTSSMSTYITTTLLNYYTKTSIDNTLLNY